MDACLHKLYNEFRNGKKYFDQQKDYTIHRQVIENESMFPVCLHKKSRFFSDHIKHKIIDEGAYLLTSSCKMLGKEFNINVIICNAIEYVNVEKIFFTIFLWLYVISSITTDNSPSCSRTLDITLFLVDVPKELPMIGSETIGPSHVNSGYTYTCKENNEIVIYREEEWLKVLIHESFHAYGLDFSSFRMDQYQDRIRKLFNVNVEILLYESYCETWARLLNVMINHFIEEPRITLSSFKKKCIKDFQKESVHSIIQACKILKFMGLSYTIITSDNKKLKACSLTLYRENSNVFCYYIITALLMFYADDLFKWCGDNNHDYLCIPKNPKNVIKFIEFIEQRYKTEEFVELMDDCLDMDELRDPTLRMSALFVDMAK